MGFDLSFRPIPQPSRTISTKVLLAITSSFYHVKTHLYLVENKKKMR